MSVTAAGPRRGPEVLAMPVMPTTENASPGTLAHDAGDRLTGERSRIRALSLLILSALAIGLLTALSFDPGPASLLEIVIGAGASVAFLITIAAALAVLGSMSQPVPPAAGRAAATRSDRVLVTGFLVGMVLMIILGCVAGRASLGEAPVNSPDAGTPFESTDHAAPAGGVDRA
jgi:hypothetical protein